MFATIRAKLIGFSFLSLLFIALVSGAGYYGYYGLTDVIQDTRDGHESIKAGMLTDRVYDRVRGDVLQILRSTINGDMESYNEAAMT